MLFLWKTTTLGKIWLDGEGVRQIVSKRLPAGYYCQEVSFVGDESQLNFYITVPENAPEDEKKSLTDKFRELFKNSALNVDVSWMQVAPQDNPTTTPIWTLPLFWAGAAALVTSLVHMGLKGILWALFAAVIGYGVAWILLTEDGQKQLDLLKKQFKR